MRRHGSTALERTSSARCTTTTSRGSTLRVRWARLKLLCDNTGDWDAQTFDNTSVVGWLCGWRRGPFAAYEPPGPQQDRALRNIELTQVDISFKVPGKLVERTVDEGDSVKRGMLIARIDRDII